MFDIDLFSNLEPIDITPLLIEIDLPIRLVNRLKKKTFTVWNLFIKQWKT